MLDVADVVVLNKYEKRGSEDALRAIRKQVRAIETCSMSLMKTCQ